MPRPVQGFAYPSRVLRVPFLQLGVGRPAAVATVAEEAWTVLLRKLLDVGRRLANTFGVRLRRPQAGLRRAKASAKRSSRYPTATDTPRRGLRRLNCSCLELWRCMRPAKDFEEWRFRGRPSAEWWLL
jgi:hypothetical protein